MGQCFRKAEIVSPIFTSDSSLITNMTKEEIQKKIVELEAEMIAPDFWADKEKAQNMIKEVQKLKVEMEGGSKYDKGDAIMTIFSGAGGDDAEDFSAMLLKMYMRYFDNNNFNYQIIHQNQNNNGGFRNITLEIVGKSAYGTLRNESGVHRLVRVSPFNANQKRHTSFSMVEVIPKFEKQDENEIEIKDDEIKVEFTRSSGPGGQNVNKRETAVRIVHLPTNISVHIDSERSQGANKEKALSILKAKIYKMQEEEKVAKEKGMFISKTTSVEWGNQIRSYVLHPYKMVKDHRTGVETNDVEGVLEDGKLDDFIKAENGL